MLAGVDANDSGMGHRFIHVEIDIRRSFLDLGYPINEDRFIRIVVDAGKFELSPLDLAAEPFCQVVGIQHIGRIPITIAL